MKILLFAVALLFSACSTMHYEQTQPKLIIIKSPQLKFADLGYIRHTDDKVELELFVAGKAIEKITINYLICVNKGCMSRSGFNEDYLSEYYDDNLLQDVLLGHTIFDAKNRVQTQSGFEQKIVDNHMDITYRVDAKGIYFKDRTNKILIKIKDTNNVK